MASLNKWPRRGGWNPERRIEITETIDGTWIVLVNGFQWAPAGEPRDASGAGGAEYVTPEEACDAYDKDNAR